MAGTIRTLTVALAVILTASCAARDADRTEARQDQIEGEAAVDGDQDATPRTNPVDVAESITYAASIICGPDGREQLYIEAGTTDPVEAARWYSHLSTEEWRQFDEAACLKALLDKDA